MLSTQMCLAATTKQIWNFMSDAVTGMDIDLHLVLCLKKAVAYVRGEKFPRPGLYSPSSVRAHQHYYFTSCMDKNGSKDGNYSLWGSGR